jgi:hypothetical protein
LEHQITRPLQGRALLGIEVPFAKLKASAAVVPYEGIIDRLKVSLKHV